MRTHVLHIYHQGLHQRTKRALSTDKETTLYTFEQKRKSGSNFTSTPHVRIYNGLLSTEQKNLQGVIDFYGSAISLEIHGQPRIVMSTTGSMTTRAHEYKSVALPGRTLKWKKHGFWSRGDWICEDQHGEIVARLKRSGLSVSKTGTFELGPLVEEGGNDAMIEIVAGGVALIELRKKQDLESRGDVEGGSGY